jgi:predicted dehydrogenase
LSEYALEIKAFAEYVLDGTDRPTTGRSERRSLAIVQAGYESAASGQPIVLLKRFGAI